MQVVVLGLAIVLCAVSSGAAESESDANAALRAAEEDGSTAPRIALEGVTVTPLVRAEGLHYSPPPGEPLGALIQLFVRNTSTNPSAWASFDEARFNGVYPLTHILKGEWAWHDTPDIWKDEDRKLPPGALSVWTIDAVRPTWVGDGRFTATAEDWTRGTMYPISATIEAPSRWISAVTFLGSEPSPTETIIHVSNNADTPIHINAIRFWLPRSNERYRALFAGEWRDPGQTWPKNGGIPAKDKGIILVSTEPLPLTYAALEVHYEDENGAENRLWTYLRIKREVFDISGGWCGGIASDGKHLFLHEPYLKQLKRLYVNTAHVGEVPGYHDGIGTGGLYDRYPIKQFGNPNREKYDSVEMSRYVHGFEVLGEPQLPFAEGGHLPQEVFKTFQKLFTSHIPTTITLSDEGTFPYYAGLSDYPHYDAYRVCAPAADVWTRYDRWGEGERIGWAAPLEGIGEMCRVLREMSRPKPMAIWSQGPHEGWYEMDGRTRTSPTSDELRVQAYHALSSRITSLYWFNLSLKSQIMYRDTLSEITRIGREIRMLEEFYLRGDAYRYRQARTPEGVPDWDLASIAAPQGALLFALDLSYRPDSGTKTFLFGPPREVELVFDLPHFLGDPRDVFRVDADGVQNVRFKRGDGRVTITDSLSKVGIYVATSDRELRNHMEARRKELIAYEDSLEFDPAENNADFAALASLAGR